MAIVSSAASSYLPSSSFCPWSYTDGHLYSAISHSGQVTAVSSSTTNSTISRHTSTTANTCNHAVRHRHSQASQTSLSEPSGTRDNPHLDSAASRCPSRPESGTSAEVSLTSQVTSQSQHKSVNQQPQLDIDCPASDHQEVCTDTSDHQEVSTDTIDHQEVCTDTSDQFSHATTCGRKKQKKIRAKTMKKWRPMDLSDFGFHMSLLPQLPHDVTGEITPSEENNSNNTTAVGVTHEIEVKTADQNQNQDKAIVEICNQTNELSDSRVDAPHQLEANNDIDDLSFFKALGIDVTGADYDTTVDECLGWDGVCFTPESVAGGKKSKSARHIKNDQRSAGKQNQVKPQTSQKSKRTANDLPAFSCPVSISSLAKCDRDVLFQLECSTSRKVYIRSDRHRKVEKAHKAVKSKNCRSIFNNRARKRFYMHHRLVKMHNLNLDFRFTAKSGKVPPMPKGNIDNGWSRDVTRADRRGRTAGSRDRPAPKQNLAFALHETNAPGHLATDLASFLISLQHRELTPEDYDMLLRLDDSVKPKTVPCDILSSLRTETVGAQGISQGQAVGDELPMCVVCMEPYTAGQLRKFLPCQHHFHSTCIDNWLTNSSMNCPLDGLPVGPS